MDRKFKESKNERGITLIVLVITVIVLVILSVVTIRTMTGNESIIKVSKESTNDYNVMQYKEQIAELRDSIILKYELLGEKLTLDNIAKEMEMNTTWIKRATANTDKDVNNEDIIVVTTDGYIFQVYYDFDYGQKYIEYVGKEDGSSVPNVVARYNKETNKIVIAAREGGSGVQSIEVMYKGETVSPGKVEASNLEYTPPKTGWYTIKVTSTTGKLRYAWIRVSSTIATPLIRVAESGEQENGWYGKDNRPVVVEITAKGDKVKEIHYTTNGWETEEVVTVSSITLDRNNKSRNNKYICVHSR